MFARYQSGTKRKSLDGVIYRLASEKDADAIAKITFDREGGSRNKSFEYYLERTKNELKGIELATDFNLIVAEYEGDIIGFGRSIYYDLEKIQVPYSAPSGWYLMGVVVRPEFRRYGIGHRIVKERVIHISENFNEIYFIVDVQNKVSIRV